MISILICSVCNTYSTQDIEIYKPYYRKLTTNNLQSNIYRTVPNVLQTNNLQSIYNSSQTLLQINSPQLSHNGYITNSSMQSSIYSSSQTNGTSVCNKTISSQNSRSNIYNILNSSSDTSSNNDSLFIRSNLSNQDQSNISCNSIYSSEQQHSNLIHLNINFNNISQNG